MLAGVEYSCEQCCWMQRCCYFSRSATNVWRCASAVLMHAHSLALSECCQVCGGLYLCQQTSCQVPLSHQWRSWFELAKSSAHFPANMLTLGQRRQTLALERQRRRRVTMLAQRCSDDGWRRRRTKLSHHRVTTLVQHCSDDGWRHRWTTLSHRRVTTLAQRCSDEGWRRRRTTSTHRRVTTLVQRWSDDGWRRRRTTLSHRRVTTLTQHCSDNGWRRRRTTVNHRRMTTLAQHCSDDGWRRRRTTLSQRRANFLCWTPPGGFRGGETRYVLSYYPNTTIFSNYTTNY